VTAAAVKLDEEQGSLALVVDQIGADLEFVQ
jgi:hypothetical protein